MQVIQGGLHRPTKNRNTVRLALAISALALAFPATAFGAQSSSGHNSTSATGRSSDERGLGRTVLAFGSGYSNASGSPQVRSLQRHLALAGYSPGAIDGLFGPRTQQAVHTFQTSHGLRVDGIVGPQTWAALSSPVRILGPGAGGQPGGSNVVRSLQRRLASAGDSPGPIDGRYGIFTEDAVRRFQRAHGLQVTGMADPRTFAFLSTLARSNHRSNPLPEEPASSVPRPSIGSRAPGNTRAPATVKSAPRAANPAPATINPVPTPERRPATAAAGSPLGSGHRPSSGSVPWMTIVAALALILVVPLLIIGFRHLRRRDRDETAVATTANDVATTANDEAMRAPREQTVFTTTNGHHEALAPENEDQIHTNGHRANANGAQGGNGAESRPSRTDEMGLSASAEAAGAFNLGLEAQGGAVEAQAAYGRADQRGHGTAASSLGRLLEEQGGPAEAEAAYHRADDHGDAVAAFNLGVVLEAQGALLDAEQAYRRADERGDAAGAFNLGLLLEGQGGAVEAQAAYGRADQRGHGTAASSLGRLLEEQGALAEAEAAYRRADERGDDTGALHLGALLEKQGAHDEAAAAYRRASDRGNNAAACCLGVLLGEQGALTEAEAAFRRADVRGDAYAAFNLAVVLETRGALLDAEQAYVRAGERGDPDIANMAQAALLDLRDALHEASADQPDERMLRA